MCSGPRIGKLLMMGRCINKGESKSENGCNSLFFVCVFVYAQLFTIIIYFPDSQRKNKTDDTLSARGSDRRGDVTWPTL